MAAGVLSSGLSTLEDSGQDAPRSLLDILFVDGTSVVALAHPALAALLLHDRDVVTRTIERLQHTVRAEAEKKTKDAGTLLEDAQVATGLLTEKASSMLSSAFDLIRREKKT